jgi:hypothetical protein
MATPLGLFVGETVPHGGVEQLIVQVTPRSAGSPATVAVICAVVLIGTVLALEVTRIVTPVIVISAVLDTDGFATDVAVIITPRSPAGGVLGAV